MHRRMVKCCSLVLGVLAAIPLDAQSGPTPARIGIIGGLNLATFGGEDAADDLTNRMGLLGGISLVKARAGGLGFEIDALYAQKGAKSEGAASEATFKLDYIEVPLLVRYEFPMAGSIRPHVVVGPSLALRTGCSSESTSTAGTVSLDCDAMGSVFGSELKTLDAGVVAGGGVDFSAGRSTLTVGARYNFGLLSIVDEFSTKHRAISVFAGVSIPLTR